MDVAPVARDPKTGLKVGAELQLSAPILARDGVVLAAPSAFAVHDGVLEGVGSSYVETIENRDDGVEQTWRLPSKPHGHGTLTIRMSTSGQRHVADDDKGSHFVDSATGLGVSYGAATFIDATGHSVRVLPAVENGELLLRFPEELVEHAAYPVVIDPIIGPETSIGPVPVGASGYQRNVDIAYDAVDDLYLAVWEDQRGSVAGIRAARFSTTLNQVLDPAGILLPTRYGKFAENPRVAFNGTTFLVAYQEWYSSSDTDIIGVLVSPNGTTGSALVIDNSGTFSTAPALAAVTGGNFLVAWKHGTQIATHRVSGTGSVLEASATIVSGIFTDLQAPTVGMWGSYGLVAMQGDQIYGRRVDLSTGLAVSPYALATLSNVPANCAKQPALLTNGSLETELFYDDICSTEAISWARMNTTGTWPGITAASTIPGLAGHGVSVAGAGSDVLVGRAAPDLSSWGTASVHLGTSSATVNFQNSLHADPMSAPNGRVAQGASGYASAYNGYNDTSGRDIFFGRFGATRAETLPDGLLTFAAGDQPSAVVGYSYVDSATGKEVQTYAWVDQGQLRFASSVPALDPSIQVESPSIDTNHAAPMQMLRVWRNITTGAIQSQQVTPSGVGALNTLASSGYRPRVTWTGTQFLVVWTSAPGESSLYSARVSASGVVIDTVPRLVTTDSAARPDLACTSTVCMIAYEHTSSGSSTEIFGAKMTPAGVFSNAGQLVFPAPFTTTPSMIPQIASSPSGFLLVAAYSLGVIGYRFGVDGTSSGTPLFTIDANWSATTTNVNPNVTYDGANFLVVYDVNEGTSCAARGTLTGTYVPATGSYSGSKFTIQTATFPVERHIRGGQPGATAPQREVYVPYVKATDRCGDPLAVMYARKITN